MGQFTNKQKPSFLGGLVPSEKQEYTPTPTHEYKYTPNPKEKKTKRLQLVIKESTFEELGRKAERVGRSRNDIVQTLLDEYLTREE